MKDAYDAVVIGSGFGGSITGCRLSQAGHSVCILERGRRWDNSDFPRSVCDMKRLLWSDENPRGLIDYGNFKGIDVIRGTGVGGGSLVYFNVHIETPPEIFNSRWPEGIDRKVLEPYYDKVRRMIEAKPLTPPEGMDMLPRTKAFFKAARGAGSQPRLVNIAVHTGKSRENPFGKVEQNGCVYCSNNLLGCRVRAKNTLDLNYIPLAEKNGAEVFPLHGVEKISPVADGGFQVSFRNLEYDRKGTVLGKKVVVAAGTLGTVELLLKCRDMYNTLPRLSRQLGGGFSGNGDFLLEGTWDCPMDVDPTEGPSITAVADFSTRHNSIFIEDLGFPNALAWYLEGALPNLNRTARALKLLKSYILQTFNIIGDNRLAAHLGVLAGGKTANLLPYLGMGTDAADGLMNLNDGKIHIQWDSKNSRQMFDEMETALKRLSSAIGGKYITSPLWKWPARKLLTAHPLGGCRMADNSNQGVVNQFGEVFGYQNLYVVDGSIIPTALSVNPSMTISALAERIAEHIVKSWNSTM